MESWVLLSGAEIDRHLVRGCHKCGNTEEFNQTTVEQTHLTLLKCDSRFEAGDYDTWADHDVVISCAKCDAEVWRDEWLNRGE